MPKKRRTKVLKSQSRKFLKKIISTIKQLRKRRRTRLSQLTHIHLTNTQELEEEKN